MSSKQTTRAITYLAMFIAMYVILKLIGDMVPILKMPNGGSIELELIAVFLAGFYIDWRFGAMTAILSWLLTIVLGFTMYFVHPVQVMLDYLIPVTVCGLAPILWPLKNVTKTTALGISIAVGVFAVIGTLMGYGISFPSVVSGILIGAAIFAFSFWYLKGERRFGIVTAMLLKYFSTVLSGAYFWAEGAAAGSMPAWIFSLNYNLGYNLVTMAVCIFAVPLILDRLPKNGL